jgi:plasmid stabilization system protein ParE
MPAKFTVRYLPAAEEDLISILEYIAKDSPRRAEAFVDKLDKRIRILETFPLAGRVPLHAPLRESSYRVLTVESYLVFYKLLRRTVQIHRVVHSARNINLFIDTFDL